MTTLEIARPAQPAGDSASPREQISIGAAERLGAANALRWWHTLRHHRCSQLARRAISVGRRRLPGRSFQNPGIAGSTVEFAFDEAFRAYANRKQERMAAWPAAAARAEMYARNTVCFLNQALTFDGPLDWASPKLAALPRLWRFQLEYHEWILEIAILALVRGDRALLDALWNSLLRWNDVRPPASAGLSSSADAWHPYCLSRRVPAWLTLLALAPPEAAVQEALFATLSAQVRFLMKNLERDLGGNHLLENAKALIFAGVTGQGREAERWLATGEKILKRELREQILPHGEHFERSAMYHAQMLGAVLDVRDVTATRAAGLSQTCNEVALRMGEYLAHITHPDGEIPLLADSAFGEGEPAKDVLIRCSVERHSAKETGSTTLGATWTWREKGDFLLFDAGPVGADHLPAHAHADLLTIEASIAGQRVIVDSGTYDYEAGAMRQYCRSTAAHSALEIDGVNQCDVWSRFRMGRRGYPSSLQVGATGEWKWATATHDAYRFLGVPTVGRWIGCRPGGTWLILDWAVGRGTHQFTNRLHLHPDVIAEENAEGISFDVGERSRCIRPLGQGAWSLKSGWYCPEFGTRLRSTVLEWTSRQRPWPLVCGWLISPDAAVPSPKWTVRRENMLQLTWEDEGGETAFDIPLTGPK